jgi:hypothetical protein
MLHVGLDLSRKRVDVHVLDEQGHAVWVGRWFTLPSRAGSGDQKAKRTGSWKMAFAASSWRE